MANDNKLVTLEDLGEAYTALYNRDVVTVATQQANGLMSSTDKGKLDGIEAGAQVNTVTGVKGATESDYRDGNVSLDAEDVGAISKDMNYTAATLPYANTEKIALRGTDGNNYYTTIGELASQIGGGGGTNQAALVHYVKNCGTISGSGTTLNWTNSAIDNNITENMVVLKAELSNPAAQTSDWTCTTTNGYVTITGTIASGSSTNVLLYFGVSLSTAPSIIVNLASNSSDNVLKTNPTPGVMGVLGVANGGTGASTAVGALTALGGVSKSGDTMSGNLYITSTGETYVKAVNTNTQCAIYLDSSSARHGLWSNGYYDGSNYVSDGKWLLYRENESTPHFAGLAQNLESNLSVANGGIIGSWTPEIWDYNTKKATLPAQTYYKIGPLYILFINTNIADAITIDTMLQIRGFPCASCFGGSLYCGSASDSLGGRTIQPSSIGVYVRPNYVGTIQAAFGAMLIGTNISV